MSELYVAGDWIELHYLVPVAVSSVLTVFLPIDIAIVLIAFVENVDNDYNMGRDQSLTWIFVFPKNTSNNSNNVQSNWHWNY